MISAAIPPTCSGASRARWPSARHATARRRRSPMILLGWRSGGGCTSMAGSRDRIEGLSILGTLKLDGSLLQYGTVGLDGSLMDIGTLCADGSLFHDGTLNVHGSLTALGTVRYPGSLRGHGTLVDSGSLIAFGTLPRFGSLYALGASLTLWFALHAWHPRK